VSDEQEDDFATMFEASIKARQFEQGQTIEGTIVALGSEVAFVSVGGKSEAQIPLAELKDEAGQVEVSVGDRIQARVVSTSGGITLSRRGVRNAATQRELENAFETGMAVEGKVAGVIKGGYEVRIARERAFCPLSQIDIVRTADPAVHVGKTYAFRVTEYKDGGKSIVVSRRKQLEEEQQVNAAAVREKIVPEAVLPGRVVSVLDYGAFVDLGGGIQGLLHVSDMSWSRGTTPGAVVAAGDQITVKVLRVDEATGKISLGLKQLQNDPWSTVSTTIRVGDVRSGRVTRLADFGAFVELLPGVEGLAHASTFPPTGRAGGWTNAISVGTTAAFEVLSVDLAQKRIGLAMVDEGSSRAAGATRATAGGPARAELAPGTIVTGKVERHERFGVFVFLSPGRTGLMPESETGLDRGADVKKAFPVGSEIEVAVLEADASGRRIRLSKKAVAQQREEAELREYAAKAESTAKASLGSLADKLQDALRARQGRG
jgi:small subunit ribosomal protein S1